MARARYALSGLGSAGCDDGRFILPDQTDALDFLSQLERLQDTLSIDCFDGDPLSLRAPRRGVIACRDDTVPPHPSSELS